ncbi:hypothetical protein IW138_004025 [Coemansia sp. RSA 986]|nr:hypothetical protein IW138_004025 [Coemansia sp. RSA 986]
MDYAFPFDELDPISCIGKGRDRANPGSSGVNDVLGDYLLTLVDTLDTLAIMGDREEFAKAVQNTIMYLRDFDIDSHVQVFEVTIRMLGGLLSAHIIATDENDALGMRLDRNGSYSGELLYLARDLGYRLLPAFEASPSGAPYPRTNLKHGFLASETPNTCTAGIGSLILEFGTLSRLTNETVFERVARHALQDLWISRTKANLFGNEYNVVRQHWAGSISGIGAGVDSYFEYLLKGYVYFGDESYLQMFEVAYSAILQHMRDSMAGYAFFNVNIHSKEVATNWVDSLSAFFPGLMVLAGDVEGAESAYLLYYHLWRRFRAMPERFNLNSREPNIAFYPLRPEFIESTYHLYRATGDKFYLDVGEMVLADLNALYRTACGFATLHDIHTGELEGRMESFALSETLKYLYLLFDEENPLHKVHNQYVFTTEGHLLMPLSPVCNSSAQYPQHSSFARRKLLHSSMPPKKVKPSLYNISNIRKKLQSVHPGDMFATPTRGSGNESFTRTIKIPRKCPAKRTLSINGRSGSYHGKDGASIATGAFYSRGATPMPFVDEPRTEHLRSPLEQLHVMRQLTHAIHDLPPNTAPEQRQQLVALHLNAAPVTMPLRADFYSTGLLVDNGGQQTSATPLPAGFELRGGAGTASINSSLAAAMDYGGMCSDPASLVLSQRQELWKTNLLAESFLHADELGIRDPPSYAKTWLTPHTQQFSFMEFLFSRATKRQVFGWNIPQRTKTRHGVPLLKDVWDESADMPSDSTSSDKGRPESYHGFLLGRNKSDDHEPSRRIVVTNGAGQVMSDHVIVRATVDVSLQTLIKELQAHNGDAMGSRKRKKLESAMSALCNNSNAVDLQGHDSLCNISSGNKIKGLKHTGKGGAQSVETTTRLQHDIHRKRSYVGRLADFSELSLYRGDVPFLVPQPTTLIMHRVHRRLPAGSGCTEYSVDERKFIRHKVVAARSDKDCTIREKAIHAMNAGASALLAVETDSGYSHNHTRQKKAATRQQNRHKKEKAGNQMYNRMQKQRSTANGQTDNSSRGRSRGISNTCRTSAIFSRMCLAGAGDGSADHERGKAKATAKNNDDAQGEIRRLAQQIDMPVVIVSQSAFKELERYLTAGLLVRVELL